MTNFDTLLPSSAAGKTAQGLPRPETIHLFRSKFLDKATCYGQIRLINYGLPLQISLNFQFEADFADISKFAAPSAPQKKTACPTLSTAIPPSFSYRGKDNIGAKLAVNSLPSPACSPLARPVTNSLWNPNRTSVFVPGNCERNLIPVPTNPYHQRFRHSPQPLYQRTPARVPDHHLQQTRQLLAQTLGSRLAHAHRRQSRRRVSLRRRPLVRHRFRPRRAHHRARNFLVDRSTHRQKRFAISCRRAGYLAFQQDAEPRKILHEMHCLSAAQWPRSRKFLRARYYGSVDSTPLFFVLAAGYFLRTGDTRVPLTIWSNIQAALRWIDIYGDRDHDGFVEYARRSNTGLVQQGWKDSNDSVFHANGELAEPPIALCEVQPTPTPPNVPTLCTPANSAKIRCRLETQSGSRSPPATR